MTEAIAARRSLSSSAYANPREDHGRPRFDHRGSRPPGPPQRPLVRARATSPGFIHRAALRSEGFAASALDGRPVVGICNSWSELVNCNLHFRGLADAVKRGVLEAGGLPLEFPTISLGENLMKPTTMLFRNLMAMDVEESHPRLPARRRRAPRRLRQDGAGAADGRRQRRRAAIMLTGGPADAGVLPRPRARRRHRPLALHRRRPRRPDEPRRVRRARGGRRPVARATATRWARRRRWPRWSRRSGMALPGTATIPAGATRAAPPPRTTGRRAVALARERPRARRAILTPAALRQRDHRCCRARRLDERGDPPARARRAASGVELTLDRFDEIARRTPLLANVRPSGAAPGRGPLPRRRRAGAAARARRRCSIATP